MTQRVKGVQRGERWQNDDERPGVDDEGRNKNGVWILDEAFLLVVQLNYD